MKQKTEISPSDDLHGCAPLLIAVLFFWFGVLTTTIWWVTQ